MAKKTKTKNQVVNYPFVIVASHGSTPKPVVPVIVRNPANGFDFSTWALIDTGADATAIPEYIAKEVYHDIRNVKVKRDFHFGIGGEVEVFYHTFQINILHSDTAGKITSTPAIRMPKRRYAVIPDLHVLVLGEKDFLQKYKLTIDYRKKVFSIE